VCRGRGRGKKTWRECVKRFERVRSGWRNGQGSGCMEVLYSWEPSNLCEHGKIDVKTMMMMMMMPLAVL
jgi:hypothetical protein